jgi:hypothetical protein
MLGGVKLYTSNSCPVDSTHEELPKVPFITLAAGFVGQVVVVKVNPGGGEVVGSTSPASRLVDTST